MRRRKVLAVVGGSFSAAIAGCLGGDDSDSSDSDGSDSSDSEGSDSSDSEETDSSDDSGGETAPAQFEIESIDPEAGTATVGDMVTVTAEVANTGGKSGTKTVELGVGETTIDTKDVTLDGGESKTVEFEADTGALEAGEYNHTISTGDDEASGTLTLESRGPLSIEEAVDEANKIIERLNTDEGGSIGSINAELENVDSVGTIEPVEATDASTAREEAQRLRDTFSRVEKEIFTQVPKEINAQAQDEFDFKLIEDISTIQTAEDARKEAEDGDVTISQEAVDALKSAADIADGIEKGLNTAADVLERAAEAA